MSTEMMGKLFLELSHVVPVKTGRESGLEREVEAMRKAVAEINNSYAALAKQHKELLDKHESVCAQLNSARATVRDLRG